MLYKTVPVSNVTRLTQAFGRLQKMPQGAPRIGLVHGRSGAGKTTGITWLAVGQNGVFVTASPQWTSSTMLKAIVRELGLDMVGSNQDLLDRIVGSLQSSRRPIFIDEADFLMSSAKLLETLRWIHDMANVPLLMVGMEKIARKVSAREQLARRVAEEIQFDPMEMTDARQVADTLVGLRIEDDLLTSLHDAAKGGIGRLCVGLGAIEHYGMSRGYSSIDLPTWKTSNRRFFLEK